MATTVTGGVSSTTDARSLRRKAERTRALERSVIHVILLVGSISMLFPLYWMISTSLKPQHEVFLLPPTWFPSEFQWIHYRQAFVDYFSFAQYGTNTMIITLGVPGGPAVERVARSLWFRPHPFHWARCHLHPRAEHHDGPPGRSPSFRSTSSSKILGG